MPTYEYVCECGNKFEDWQHNYKNAKEELECPKCKKMVKKSSLYVQGSNGQYLVFDRVGGK